MGDMADRKTLLQDAIAVGRVLEGQGGGKGGSGGRAPRESPNTLRSKAVARVVDVVAEGPIQGLVDGMKSIFFDGTPLENADGSFNFTGVEVIERIGQPTQEPVPGYPSIESSVGVGVAVLAATPVTRTLANGNLDAVRVTLRTPQLMRVKGNGDIVETEISFAIDVQASGGSFVEVLADTIRGKTTSPYDVAYRVELPAGGAPWTVRVRRLTADSAVLTLSNDLSWVFYTEIIDHRMIYPDTAYFALSVDSAAFGNAVPVRAYEIDGIEMKIPGNYDPATRAYDGDWDGSFTTAWTDNPAWVFYLLATHERFGLGRWLEESLLDKWALYQIAVYCDELVDDGAGGLEPRFTFNGVIETREEALKVLQLIAGAFRGMAYWSGSLLTATQDRPTDPAVLVTPANVLDGTFNYSGIGFKARHSVAMVTWNDPADGYRTAIELVEDAELLERYGWRPADTVAYGCTSRGQAHRLGKWLLDSERHENQVLTYQASFDHMVADGTAVLPGDVILVQDPSFAGVRFGGRLAVPGTTAVELDAEVTLEVGENYVLHVVLPDGTLAEIGVASPAGTTAELELDGDLPTAPLVGAMWVLTASNVAPRTFRVLGVREVEKNVVEVTALLHDPTKYARVEEGVILESPPFSVIPGGPLLPPTDMTLREYVYRSVGTPRAAVAVSWKAPANEPRAAFYEVQVSRPGRSFVAQRETAELQTDVTDIEPGVHGFRVRALDATGNRSPWLTRAAVVLTGLDVRPADVTGFNLQSLGDTAHLSWVGVDDPGLSHYRIKFQPTLASATWGRGVDLVSRVSRDATGIALPAMIGTYMIKGESALGRQSVNAAFVVTNVLKLHGLNVVAGLAEQPDFDGVKTGLAVDMSTNALRLDQTGGIYEAAGLYEFALSIDLGQVFTSRVGARLDVSSFNPDVTMSSWDPLSSVDPISGADPSVWSATLQLSTTGDDPDDSPDWAAWQNLAVGDYTARAYRFRLLLETADTDITPSVSRLEIEVDMPDRVTGARNVLSPVEGASIVYDPAFSAQPAVAITLQGATEGDQAVLSNESAEGFDIVVVNDGVGVARTFNWIAQGYGHVDG
jgi:predicted phage tail protein